MTDPQMPFIMKAKNGGGSKGKLALVPFPSTEVSHKASDSGNKGQGCLVLAQGVKTEIWKRKRNFLKKHICGTKKTSHSFSIIGLSPK